MIINVRVDTRANMRVNIRVIRVSKLLMVLNHG